MKTACTVPPQLTLNSQFLNCDPPWLPLNGSAFLQYNSTSYNDDMAWAATWMYRCAPCSPMTAHRVCTHPVARIWQHISESLIM